MNDLIHKEITEKIIKTFYRVYNDLEYGVLETVYEKALELSLKSSDLDIETQKPGFFSSY